MEKCITIRVLIYLLALWLLPVSSTFAQNVIGHGLKRKTIYHSPQQPGYTCWVGAWTMADNSLMVTFKQATGPLEGRPRSTDLFQQMGIRKIDPQRDFTGL